MPQKSVAIRQRAAYDFESCYSNLCALQSTIPLPHVKAHLKELMLDINADKVRMLDWGPILDSIKINKSLHYIAIKSYHQSWSNSSGKKLQYFKRKTPEIRSKDVTYWIANTIEACISSSNAIRCIDLQGVPLREKDVSMLAKGIEKNSSLNRISVNYCQISDKGAKLLCHALKNHPTITHVSLCGCNITSEGAEEVSNLMKHQSTLRHSEAWAESLRYRKPNFSCMSGIRRITLNSNPMIGDEGAAGFSDALKDDLWVKALDLQHCGISTQGALTLLAAVQHNNTVVVLDVRKNPMIDSATLRSLLGRVLINANEKDEVDYPWVKEEAPKDPQKTKRFRPTRLNRSFSKKSAGKSAQRTLSYEGLTEKLPPGHKRSVPWRTAVRASQHKLGFVDEESDMDEPTIIRINADHSVNTSDSDCIETSDNTNLDETHLSLKESHAFIRQLKVDVINSRRKLAAAKENEKRLHDRIMALEVENARLQKVGAESFENSRLKSQIEDDMLLDSIEHSFNKFHDFLNMLNEVGLGSLASAAGLDGEFSIPYEQRTGVSETLNSIKEKPERKEKPIDEKAIIIQGGSLTPKKQPAQKVSKASSNEVASQKKNPGKHQGVQPELANSQQNSTPNETNSSSESDDTF